MLTGLSFIHSLTPTNRGASRCQHSDGDRRRHKGERDTVPDGQELMFEVAQLMETDVSTAKLQYSARSYIVLVQLFTRSE